MIGYRADDSYFSFARDFINGSISYRQLSCAIKLGNLGEQIVLISQKAFNNLSFKGYEISLRSEYYSKKENRDKQVRNQYLDNERYKRNKNDLFITNVIDEEMKVDDPRLR